MVNNLDNLIDKLYDEGINKVKKESEELLNETRAKAGKIISDAEKEAEAIVNKAQTDAEQTRRRVRQEMQTAYEDILLSLKDQISKLITYKLVAKDNVKAILSSKDFIKEVLETLIKNWSEYNNVDLYFSKLQKDEVEKILNNEFKDIVSKGISVKFSDDAKFGFTIQDKDGTYSIIFNEDTVGNLFVEKLRPFVKKVLFEDRD